MKSSKYIFLSYINSRLKIRNKNVRLNFLTFLKALLIGYISLELKLILLARGHTVITHYFSFSHSLLQKNFLLLQRCINLGFLLFCHIGCSTKDSIDFLFGFQRGSFHLLIESLLPFYSGDVGVSLQELIDYRLLQKIFHPFLVKFELIVASLFVKLDGFLKD